MHYENPFFSTPRGVVVALSLPEWPPSAAFMDALLLEGLSGNQILSPVTLGVLFSQVPAGGNREPAVRLSCRPGRPTTASRGAWPTASPS